MKKSILVSVLVLAPFVLALPIGSVFAATPGFGHLYYNGTIVHTVVPPAAFPNTGLDNFYEVHNGAAGQLGIASVAPGADGYHGGHWKSLHCYIQPRRSTSTPNVPSSSPRGPERWHSYCDKERVRRLSLPGPTITPAFTNGHSEDGSTVQSPSFPIASDTCCCLFALKTPASNENTCGTNLLESPANIHPVDSSGMLFVVSAARLNL
jgi:hypothetical protein